MSTHVGPYGDPETRTRILEAAWALVTELGASLRLADVAERAGVSRQALYLHFGDRSGLLLALVQHMDGRLHLGEALAHVRAAPTSAELLERAMRLNTEFWTAVQPIAQVLEAAQYEREALGAAWRDRMRFRQESFSGMIRQIAEAEDLARGWSVEDAAAVLYAVAHFDTWRELTRHLGWADDRYVAAMTRLLGGSLLKGDAGR